MADQNSSTRSVELGSGGAPKPGSGEEPHLSRELSNRHIQLIALGGAFGPGLFLGASRAISLAGPSVIFVYMSIGFMLFFVMRAMGELLLSNLKYNSFTDFAADLLGPWAGFFTGWTYWLCWTVAAIANIVAIAGFVLYWWPDLDLWIPALVAVVVLLLMNLPTAKAFGEAEFWFVLIKVVAVVCLIVVGLILVITHFISPTGVEASFGNLWNDGGMFPRGAMGFVLGFQIAVFAFGGVELVGTTAAETKDPEKNLPKAVNSVPPILVLFYVLSLSVIMAVIPWSHVESGETPFTSVFALAGLGIAAGVIHFVVLTSAASSANSGIYSTSRMLYGLAQEGDAPGRLGKLNSRRVPANALAFSAFFLLTSVVLLFSADSVIEVFTTVTSIVAVLFIFVWSMILASYLVYRKRRPELHEASKFKMPGGVVMCWAVFAFFAFIVWALTQDDDTLVALLITPFWFAGLGIAWVVIRRRPAHVARYTAFKEELRK
ncbi:D-serine/D-alanine/glycine transporter [Rhodococcus sp. WMMA185]|uniref:amino acid permease n=1 Tax=Rhodococcus sp. WMMA185 TaxID=679318 RepID=UPI000877F1D2|nr:amino acid permease [Rhodococcus sp. WMMA185]AOW93328.1 D-serine/D-alanine/glycine transporter [Rhodococcus sp. WMMA185]